MKTLLSILLITFAACEGAHRDAPDTSDARAPGPSCGGDVCNDEPAATCVDGDTLRTYSTTCEDDSCSYPSTDTECGSLGCCDDHCCGVSPSNAIEIGSLAQTGIEVEALSGTFDANAECTDDSRLGRCTVVAREGLPDACVCRADRIRIGSLRVTGTRALVLLAWRDVLVTGLLDVSADLDVDGPGASAFYADPQTSSLAGGAGGSFGTRGGGAGVEAAMTYGKPTLIPLTGGMRGQAATGVGGGGGGAVQIVAGQRVEIVGVVHAGGGGGRAPLPGDATKSGGGGGGSGGAILVEAPTVSVAGKLLANGGSGASGSSGNSAGVHGKDAGGPPDGLVTDAPAPGTVSPSCSTPWGNGGSGAAGTTAAVAGSPGTTCGITQGGGGGGGGVGRIRINSLAECACSGTISPATTVGTVLTR